jgi:hypothetical protein
MLLGGSAFILFLNLFEGGATTNAPETICRINYTEISSGNVLAPKGSFNGSTTQRNAGYLRRPIAGDTESLSLLLARECSPRFVGIPIRTGFRRAWALDEASLADPAAT